MDYTKESTFFKLKKAVRYLKLYGLSRTIVKIKGQYHMNKKYDVLPSISIPTSSNKHIGILGAGNFSFSNIAYYLNKNFGKVIRGVMDIDANRAASLYETYKADYYTTNADDIIFDKKIDIIYIVSNHASHAEYAIKAIEQGKAVHIEKPHAVTTDQLVRLCEAMKKHNGKVRLGFNRPNSYLGQMVIDSLNTQTGAVMLNWFVAGHEIEPDHWYFAAEEGGRVLGNLCHWTDLVFRMIPDNPFPIKIIPCRSERSDCDISVNYVFGNGSIATITFSAKGHTFEGVRETLNAHRGNVLVNLKDFGEVRIDNIDKVYKKKLWFRDHGHQKAVVDSYNMLTNPAIPEPIHYVWNSGYLVLKTKEALEKFEIIVMDDFPLAYPTELKVVVSTT